MLPSIKLKRITYQQHGSKYFDCQPSPSPQPWVISQNSTFSEHGHVAYQLKGITKCSSIVANFLPTVPPSPYDHREKGSRGQNSTFSEHGHTG